MSGRHSVMIMKHIIAGPVLFGLLMKSAESASYVFAPLEEVYACPGEQVALTCQTNNYSLLEWQIVVPEHQRIEYRYISASLVVGYLTKLQINSTVFNFSRTSEYETAPLVSTLLISYIAADLNQTLIYCSELGHLYENRVFVAKIYVIERANSPEIAIILSEQFEKEHVSVLLEWSKMNGGVIFNVCTTPQVIESFAHGSSISYRLNVSYNTQYNVSIVATLCGQSHITITELNYAKCEHLQQELNHSMVIMDYKDPSIEGSKIEFSCPPGFVLTGPSTAVCTQNGDWEPDPREAVCKADCGPVSLSQDSFIFPFVDTMEGTHVTFTCQRESHKAGNLNYTAVCSQWGIWKPDPSSICYKEKEMIPATLSCDKTAALVCSLVFILCSPLICVIGFICGRICQTHKLQLDTGSVPSTSGAPSSDVRLKEAYALDENVAYGTVQELATYTIIRA